MAARTLLAISLLAIGCAAAPPAHPLAGPRWIDVVVDDQDLSDVCERIGAEVGATIVVDPSLQRTVTARLHAVPWREAVDELAARAGCEVRVASDGALVVYRPLPWIGFDGTGSAGALLQFLAASSQREILLPPGLSPRLLSFHGSGRVPDLMRAVLDQARLPYDIDWDDPIRLYRRPKVELEPRLFELR